MSDDFYSSAPADSFDDEVAESPEVPEKYAHWWPAALALPIVIGAGVLAYLSFAAPPDSTRLVFAGGAYAAGAIVVAVIASVQRILDTQAVTDGYTFRGGLRGNAYEIAKWCQWVGIAVGLYGAFIIATELAK